VALPAEKRNDFCVATKTLFDTIYRCCKIVPYTMLLKKPIKLNKKRWYGATLKSYQTTFLSQRKNRLFFLPEAPLIFIF